MRLCCAGTEPRARTIQLEMIRIRNLAPDWLSGRRPLRHSLRLSSFHTSSPRKPSTPAGPSASSQIRVAVWAIRQVTPSSLSHVMGDFDAVASGNGGSAVATSSAPSPSANTRELTVFVGTGMTVVVHAFRSSDDQLIASEYLEEINLPPTKSQGPPLPGASPSWTHA